MGRVAGRWQALFVPVSTSVVLGGSRLRGGRSATHVVSPVATPGTALGNEVFALLGRTGTRQCPVAITGHRPSTSPLARASASPSAPEFFQPPNYLEVRPRPRERPGSTKTGPSSWPRRRVPEGMGFQRLLSGGRWRLSPPVLQRGMDCRSEE